ncbi:MAG: succinyl-diaminopimelate desuccinylase [Gammaproteobacteria bacterium]|nr:succinyl-diaminopimelate desuccinylase [Gammaproteobacteria bacterium]
MSPTVELARELIRLASVTPEDAGCQELMIERLSALGFRIECLPFGEVKNLWAEYGEAGPLFAFAGHTDVVPTGPEARWTHPPFAAEIVDGRLYGRGAADMKGSLAAMITACERLLTENPGFPGRIAFLITSDEEGPAVNGTRRVVDWLVENGRTIDWCLVGEPSSEKALGDTIKNGRRGSLSGTLTVRGIQGHIAYPHLARNPIHDAAPVLGELCSREWDSGNQYFPPTSFQISNISGGTGAENVIPGQVEIMFNFRYSTEQTAAGLKDIVEQTCARHGLDYQIDWRHSGAPFLTPVGDLVEASSAAIANVTGIETRLSTAGGTSDGRFIAPMGAQVIELGPLNATIHQVDEHVSTHELDALSRIYENIMQRLFDSK